MAQGEPRKPRQQEDEATAEPLNEQQIGAEFAKAFQELARGEQTAASLESKLDEIESRIEQLIASAEENARQSASLRTDSATVEQKDTQSSTK